MPPWTPPRLFQNSDQWQSVPEYRAFTQPLRDNEGTYTCEMVKWGELRAIMAEGVTTPSATAAGVVLDAVAKAGAD